MTPDERESRIADALADYLDRQAQAETVDLDAFCAGHPDLAPDLREELDATTAIDNILEPPAAARMVLVDR